MSTTPFITGFPSGLSFALASTLLPAVVLAAAAPLPCDEHTAQKTVQQTSRPATFAASAMAVLDGVPAPDGTTRPMRIEVRIENGKVSAEVDGTKVEADRIILEEGRVVILGPDGEPIRELPMVMVEPSGATRMVFETFDAIRRRVGDVATWSFDATDRGAIGRALQEAAIAGAHARRYFGELELHLSAAAQPDAAGEADSITIAVRPALKAMIGVTLADPDPALLRHLKLAEGEVTMLTGIVEGLPAEEARLEAFDIVVAVDGRSPSGPQALRDALAERQPGDVMRLTVLRAGERRDVEVTLAAFDPSNGGMAGVAERSSIDRTAAGKAFPGVRLSLPDGTGVLRAAPAISPQTLLQGLPRIVEVAPMPGGDRFLYQIDRDRDASAIGQPAARSAADASTDARLEKLEARLDELNRTLERLVKKLDG